MSKSVQENITTVIQEQQAQWVELANKALESSMKLLELNIRMAKQTFDDSTGSARDLMAVKNPTEVFTLDQHVMQEKLNRMLAYANEMNSITSEFTAELGHATQSKLTEGLSHAGVDAGKAFPFTQLGNPQQGYEQWVEAGKKFAESFGMKIPSEVPVKKSTSKKES